MAHTKQFTFLFLVDPLYMPNVKVKTQYEINVVYTLDYRGRVEVIGYTVKPGMAQHIHNWDRLELEMKEAAENNSKGKVKPGDYRGHMRPEGANPYEDISDEWKRTIREKEANGW